MASVTPQLFPSAPAPPAPPAPPASFGNSLKYVWFWWTVSCLIGIGLMAGTVGAQSDPPSAPPQATVVPPEAVPEAASEAAIVAKRDDLKQKRVEIEQQRETTLAGQNTEAGQELTAQLEQLDKLDRLFDQQLAALQQGHALTEDLSQLQDTLSQQRASGPPEPPPYTVLLLNYSPAPRLQSCSSTGCRTNAIPKVPVRTHSRRLAGRLRRRSNKPRTSIKNTSANVGRLGKHSTPIATQELLARCNVS